ncbi:prepilin-type N-terminal cleavage/methylation domain-containing protein, partial [Achromobacter sp. Marseille-Q0513]|uniref:PulJ/GspJ family protein n=1 Tax=Achromobacter sp. Marseille-Q0513 TaxID=2829161 RepID=UPI001B9D6C22
MRAPPARRAQRGFTLIEVLVALALMALVSLISWRGLASVSSARDWIESQAEDTDAIVRSLGQLGRDGELSY